MSKALPAHICSRTRFGQLYNASIWMLIIPIWVWYKLGNFEEIICFSPYMIDISFTLSTKERYLHSFMLLYLLKCVKKGEFGICWGFLIGNVEDRVILYVMDHGWCCFTLRKLPCKFHANMFIRSKSGIGGWEGGYLEDGDCYWLEMWRTGSSLMSWIFSYPKEDTLKVLCWYIY